MMKSVVIALLLLLADEILAREDRVIRRLGDMTNEVEDRQCRRMDPRLRRSKQQSLPWTCGQRRPLAQSSG